VKQTTTNVSKSLI